MIHIVLSRHILYIFLAVFFFFFFFCLIVYRLHISSYITFLYNSLLMIFFLVFSLSICYCEDFSWSGLELSRFWWNTEISWRFCNGFLFIFYPSQSFADKMASSVYRCYHAVNLRPIFTSRLAFNSTNKDKLTIFKQSNLIYKFTCRCNSTYIGMTCQRLEVRVRQHIPRFLLSGWLTSGHSQAMDSAIGEHLLSINSCRTSNEDDCFSVLHRARDKFHLKFLEAIYISMNRPSLCRQLNNHTLNILGELLDTGVT